MKALESMCLVSIESRVAGDYWLIVNFLKVQQRPIFVTRASLYSPSVLFSVILITLVGSCQ